MQRWLGTVGRVLVVGCHVRMIDNMFMVGCDWLSLVLIVRCMHFLLMFIAVVASYVESGRPRGGPLAPLEPSQEAAAGVSFTTDLSNIGSGSLEDMIGSFPQC